MQYIPQNTTFIIPVNTNETIELDRLELDGKIFNIKLEYNYNINEGEDFYNENLDYWDVVLLNTSNIELYRTKATINFNFLKYAGIASMDGVLIFSCEDGRQGCNVKKNDFIDKKVSLDYISIAEIKEQNLEI